MGIRERQILPSGMDKGRKVKELRGRKLKRGGEEWARGKGERGRGLKLKNPLKETSWLERDVLQKGRGEQQRGRVE